jgi:hypothetical protein
MVVTFRERNPRARGGAVVRQYWERGDREWKIVAQSTVR